MNKRTETNHSALLHGWDALKEKFPMPRESMEKDQERQFVEECFRLYESEGFAECFESPYEDYQQYCGEKFTVLHRCDEPEWDLCTLPAWVIEFEPGVIIEALPEEITKAERTDNQSAVSSVQEELRLPLSKAEYESIMSAAVVLCKFCGNETHCAECIVTKLANDAERKYGGGERVKAEATRLKRKKANSRKGET